MTHSVKVVPGIQGHYRWVCTCGARGTNLCFRESVEALAAQHLRKVR